MGWETIGISLGLRLLFGILDAEKVLPEPGNGAEKKNMVIDSVVTDIMDDGFKGDGVKRVVVSLLGSLIDKMVADINRNGGFFGDND